MLKAIANSYLAFLSHPQSLITVAATKPITVDPPGELVLIPPHGLQAKSVQ